MVRIVDAYISNVARAAMTAQLGEDRALRLVPESGEEAASLQRMRTIAGLIGVDLELLRTDKVPGPADVRTLVTGIQQRLTGVDERAGRILQRSSAQEFLMDIQWGLSQHAVARGIKLMNGLFLSSSD